MPPNQPPSFEQPQPSKLEATEKWPPSLDRWLEIELDRQYDDLAKSFRQLGLVHPLPEQLEMGIIGIDGREYPIPSREAIKQKILENKDVIKQKMSQGFTRLQLTPFALPLSELIKTAKQTIIKHHQTGKLFTAKQDPNDLSEPPTPLTLNDSIKDQPDYAMWVWEDYKQADISGKLVYHPDEFSPENHGGLTKSQILAKQQKQNDPFAGWQVQFLEDNLNIPAEGQGKTIGNRPQLEVNRQPKQYLRTMRTDPIYQNESGLTPEDWLTLFVTHLQQTNQVIDDYAGNGKACYLTGGYFPSSDYVGYAYWHRGTRQAFLYRGFPDDFYDYDGVRSLVKV